MTAWTLRGAERLAQAIPAGTTNSAKNPVFLSLVGWLDIANPTVCAEPGKAYDLRPLAGLTVVLATRKGIDIGPFVKALHPIVAWLTVLDIDTGLCIDILALTPKPQVIRWSWKEAA